MGIVGQIMQWPARVPPKGWLHCDGTEVTDTTWPQLWEVITQTYGGDGRSVFNLPNFGTRRALGAGQGPGLADYALGSSGNDSSAGDGGIGYLDISSVICAQGTMPWEAGPGMLGDILPFAGATPPTDYDFCQGRILPIGEFEELFSIIGTQFGGDGRSTFALPDLRGRTPLGADTEHGPGQCGEDLSLAGELGYQAINYVTSLKPPPHIQGAADDPFIGEIIYTGAAFARRGFAFCEGQILPVNGNETLFELIGTTFGGDGQATFALPDLRGRVVVRSGRGMGAGGMLSAGGTGQVGYLSLRPMIAIAGLEPVSD